jgi:hypothetical protein
MDNLYICLKCIGDEPLRNIAAQEAVEVKCSYCKSQGAGILMQALANIVDEPLRNYYREGKYPPMGGEQEGDSLDYLLQEDLEIKYEVAVDLVKILEENDPADPREDESPFYASDRYYVQDPSLELYLYHDSWEYFTSRIKHERRFFDDATKKCLETILGEPDSSRAKELPLLEIGPDTKVELLWRARLVDSEEQAKTILKGPISGLGPPPAANAAAGRMNAAGISVFYGALSEDTAIAEVRPYVGNLIIVGSFRPLQKLRLLNLPDIDVCFTGSIFSPEFEDRLARRKFFQIFHSLIAKPIQPRDELLEYIPTQAVAEYVANVLKFDGILYASAQVGAISDDDQDSDSSIRVHELTDAELQKHNVVLFGKAVIVEGSKNVGGINIEDSTPVLRFEPGSENSVKVQRVKYDYNRVYIYTGEDQIDINREIKSDNI